jgi:hypothetical protein
MLHNKGTDLYNNNGRDYKVVPYSGFACTQQHPTSITMR